MRRRWVIAIVATTAVLATAVLAVRWQRTVPFGQCSSLYRQYADHADINASYIKDFYLNDSVYVDVTLLHATSDSAWAALLGEMNISQDYGNGIDNEVDRGVVINWVQKSDITKYGSPSYDKCFLQALQYSDGVVSYFEMDNDREMEAVYEYLISQLTVN